MSEDLRADRNQAQPVRLADHTTLRLGGAAAEWVVARTEAELIEAVASADREGIEVLVLGGGSNLVIADDQFAGRVVQVATAGIDSDSQGPDQLACLGAVTVTVAAGETWDALVARAVASGWVGIEALSGIPGQVGATPIQNVGAYGQSVSDTIASVRVYDRVLRGVRTFAAADCAFGYRSSRFKADPTRHVVLSVQFLFKQGTLSAAVQYAELARTLGVDEGDRVELERLRAAVLGLRAGKGMVLDAADHDTWSAGSFFTNPVLSQSAADGLPADAPRWPQPDGTVKSSAAWLIERAGFTKGYRSATIGPRVGLSTKHTLALTNRGGASTSELLALAGEIRDGVRSAFGVELVNEPVLVGCSLSDQDEAESDVLLE